MEELFHCNNSKIIKVYIAIEMIEDPVEKNTTKTLLPPLPIRAIVSDLTASQARWKLSGVDVSKSKEIYVNKCYRSLLEKSVKIEIDGEDYEGWKVNGQMQIREEGDYLRIYIYNKKR